MVNCNVSLDLGICDDMSATTCGHVIVEIVKFIVYQKLQIPYPYDRLKYLVNKKRVRDQEEVEKKETLQSRNHFRKACAALDSLDSIFKNLLLEVNGSCLPKEVCILLGATPVTCRELYKIVLPPLCHKPQCQNICEKSAQRLGLIALRSIATSDTLTEMIYQPLPPTNVHILMKKGIKPQTSASTLTSDHFVTSTGCKIPTKSKVAIIDMGKTSLSSFLCCNDFEIFEDISEEFGNQSLNDDSVIEDVKLIESSDSIAWYQSSVVVRGFKDCFVNGLSISNNWMQQN